MSRYSAEFLRRVTLAFHERRDPERAAAMAAYMRAQFAFVGIGAPARDAVIREAARGLEPPSQADLVDLARSSWRKRERDYQYAACRMLRRHERVLDETFLEVAAGLITTKSWWDTVDDLAAHVVGPLVERYPELAATLDRWVASEDVWLARTAILHQIRYRDATDERRLFDYCLRRAGDTEFFIRKAIGWALRDYAKTHPTAVKRFVRANAAVLSGLSKREALKHLGA